MHEIYVHQLSPFLVQFNETLGIRWYGLSYLLGFFLCYVSISYMAKIKTIQMSVEEVGDFIVYGALGVIIGGRLGYVIFYGPHLITQFTSEFPFWGVLEVQKGGMASHGGILGVIVAAILYARKRNYVASHILDVTVFGGALGIGFGRIANFINGELYGREASSDVSWAVKFPQEIFTWGMADREKLNLLGGAVEKLGQVKSSSGELIQATKDQWLSWISTYDIWAQRMIGEFKELLVHATQTGNQDVIHAIGAALTPRYPSQLIQAGLEGFLVFLILAVIWLKPRKPGVISAYFGILYSVARIIGEQYRLPDAQIGFQWLGLTRGQWISIGLLAGAIAYLIVALKRNTKPMGGLKAPNT